MTKRRYWSVNIPFEGFYCSRYSEALDWEESQWVEYEVEHRHHDRDGSGEAGHPEALRLTERELSDIMFRHSNHTDAQGVIGAAYVDAWGDEVGARLGFDLGAKFEEIVSPREYNFATDRMFAHIPASVCRRLWALSKADGHATLRAVIRRRFTSRDGFIPHYPNALADWPADLADWDHNELGTLLIAALELTDPDGREEDLDWAIYERVAEGETFYRAWSESVDWPAFEAARDEAREEKAADLIDDMTDDERAAWEAAQDWRTGAVVAHPAQAPLL